MFRTRTPQTSNPTSNSTSNSTSNPTSNSLLKRLSSSKSLEELLSPRQNSPNTSVSVPSVGIIGIGCVGGSVYEYFFNKDKRTSGFDKYKLEFKSSEYFDEVVTKDIVFLCLPTLYEKTIEEYDKSAIHDVCIRLKDNRFNGVVVLKSTVEPGTTENLVKMYPELTFMHNPEFLTARTCYEDFENQSHIVLGTPSNQDLERSIKATLKLESLFKHYWPDAEYSFSSSSESESMKIFCNSFYAMKIGIFNEFYELCIRNSLDFEKIRRMMLKNGWINEMHTNIPGPDGKLGYGGMCFPKDTKALLHHMKRNRTSCEILNACDMENDEWRRQCGENF